MDIMKTGDVPKYFGSWDLETVPEKELALTIDKITEETVTSQKGEKQKKTVMYFVEDYKPMILNITNKKTLVRLYKTNKSEDFKGKRVIIGYDVVTAFGGNVDALRIRNRIPKDDVIKCEQCGKNIVPAGGADALGVARYTFKKYGKRLCSSCAEKMKGG